MLQVGSVYPATHEQVYEFTPSVHVPPFWHGPGAHSLISEDRKIIRAVIRIILFFVIFFVTREQTFPSWERWKFHFSGTVMVMPPLWSLQNASNKCLLVLQVESVYPATHEQVYEFTPSVHVPPFWHGSGAHSLIS